MSETEIAHNQAQLDKVLKDAGSKLVLVNFYADWHLPSKIINPALQDIKKEYAGKLIVINVDIDVNEESPAKYNISRLSIIIFFKNEIEVAKLENPILALIRDTINQNMEE